MTWGLRILDKGTLGLQLKAQCLATRDSRTCQCRRVWGLQLEFYSSCINLYHDSMTHMHASPTVINYPVAVALTQ